MSYVPLIVILTISYLIGSINSAIIVGKLNKVDIRKIGSGNAGATNILRNLGKGPALLVIIGDALKGIIAVLIGRLLLGDEGAMMGGIAAIIGHNWPAFFQFKGGKGILTSAIVILMITPNLGILIIAIAIIIIAITRYVSLGSLVGAILYPLVILLIDVQNNTHLFIFSIIIATLAIYRHEANIKRLISGTESKLGKK